MKIALTVSKLWRGHDFHKKNSKGDNSVKMKVELRGGGGGARFAHRLMVVYICTKFHEIFSTVLKL